MATERLQRRRFLKGLGVVAAAATISEHDTLSSFVHAASQEEKKEQKLSGENRRNDEISHMAEMGWDAHARILARSQHWGVIWARAIAKAWEDPIFKAKLLDRRTVNQAFKDYFNYDINRELDLIVVEDSAEYTPGKPDPWEGVPNNELKMFLPRAPSVNQRAVALAEYTDTGRTYPFTSL